MTEVPTVSGDHAAPRYLTTDDYAAQRGLTPQRVRSLAKAGRIPGALRLSGTTGAWRFPADAPVLETTAPRDADALRGVSADSVSGAGADVMSTQRVDVDDTLDLALEVARTLEAVTTRPATALSGLITSVAGAALRHTADADGRCMSCRWPMYPCPDAKRLGAAIRQAHSIVVDGAR